MSDHGFTLQITFTGLCLYVTDESTPGDRTIHVLLPSNEALADVIHEAGAHVARLLFDPAYLVPKGVLGGSRVHVPLRKRTFELRTDEPLTGDVPGEVVFLEGRPGPDALSAASKYVASVVRLSSGKYKDCHPGVCWSWRNGRRTMSHHVEWTIRYDSSPMKLVSSSGSIIAGPLYPINNMIRLEVWNAPPHEVPPDPLPSPPPHTKPGEAHHFSAYYHVLGKDRGPLPEFWGKTCDRPGGIHLLWGGTPYRCMSAQARME